MKFILFFIFITVSIFIYLIYLQQKDVISVFIDTQLKEEIYIKEKEIKTKIYNDKAQIISIKNISYLNANNPNSIDLLEKVLIQVMSMDNTINSIKIEDWTKDKEYFIDKRHKILKSILKFKINQNYQDSEIYFSKLEHTNHKESGKITYFTKTAKIENNSVKFVITINKNLSRWLELWSESNYFNLYLLDEGKELILNPDKDILKNEYTKTKILSLNGIDKNYLILNLKTSVMKELKFRIYQDIVLISLSLLLLLSPLFLVYNNYTRRLKENIKTFEIFFNNAFDSLLLVNSDAKIVMTNKVSEKLYEINIKDILGKNIDEILPLFEKRGENNLSIRWLNRDKKKKTNNKIYIIKKTDKNLYVNILIDTIDYYGSTHFVIRVRDITKEFKFEKIFSKVFEQASVGMALISHNGSFIKVNSKLCHIFGYSEEEMLLQHFLDNINDSFIAKELDNFYKLKNTELLDYNINAQFHNKSGQKIWLSTTNTAILNFEFDFDFMLMIVIDITENKKSLEHLEETKRMLEESQNIAMIGNFEYDIINNKFNQSNSLYRLFEIEDKGYNFENFLLAIHAQNIVNITSLIANWIKNKNNIDLVFETTVNDKQYIHMIAKIEYDSNYFPLKIKGTCQNITKQKLNKQKEENNERLLIEKSKLAAMGEMIGAIAHQWRQPLNMISLLVNDIAYAYRYKELDNTYLENSKKSISDQLNFMSETIDGFRTFFKNDQEKVDVSLVELLKEIKNIYWAQLKDANIKLNITAIIDDNELDFKYEKIEEYRNNFLYNCIPIDIKQAILSIIQNAKEQIDILENKNIYNRVINIRLSKHKNKYEIIINDFAGGVNDSLLTRIFEPYYSSKQMGTGLGLYISKIALEKNNNAKIFAKNISEVFDNCTYKGLQFTIKLNIDE